MPRDLPDGLVYTLDSRALSNTNFASRNFAGTEFDKQKKITKLILTDEIRRDFTELIFLDKKETTARRSLQSTRNGKQRLQKKRKYRYKFYFNASSA